MKFITVRDLRTSPAKIWKQLSEEQEMVITNNGKPIALLTPICDTNLESTLKLIRTVKAVDAVRQLQEISLNNENVHLNTKELEKEILNARKSIK